MNIITVNELKARMDRGEPVNLLDVREDYERADFNIGGKHVPMGKIQAMEFEDIDEWRDQEVIIYCRSGNRSGIAGLFMEQAGFKNTTNLKGGMVAWQEMIGERK